MVPQCSDGVDNDNDTFTDFAGNDPDCTSVNDDDESGDPAVDEDTSVNDSTFSVFGPLEWDDLIDAIRNDTPYNEVKRGAQASLVTSMGRMAAHTGQVITYDQMLGCEHEFAPDVDKLTLDSPAPLQASSDGRYPIPLPGLNKKREYEATV